MLKFRLPQSARKFLRYGFSGVLVLLLTVVLTYCLTEIVHLYYLTSYIIVLTTATAVNFILATTFIFKTRRHHGRRLLLFVLSYLVFYSTDIMLTKVCTEFFGIHYVLSILSVRSLIFLLKFSYYNHILFRDESIFFRKIRS